MRNFEYAYKEVNADFSDWEVDDTSLSMAFEAYKFMAIQRKRIGIKNNTYIKFVKFVHSMYPEAKRILDVGVGSGQTSSLLKKCGYDVTAMDYCDIRESQNFFISSRGSISLVGGAEFNKFVMFKLKNEGIRVMNEFFTLDTPIDDYDLVVGLHACGANELIIRNCIEHNKAFVVTPCETRDSIDGKFFKSREDYITYLKSLKNDIQSITLPLYDVSGRELWGKTLYLKQKTR